MSKPITDFESYKNVYAESVQQPEKFWESVAQDFQWKKKWDHVLEYDFHKPEVKWFEGAQLNITENCLDRHLTERGNQTALIWEPNDPKGESKKFTYRELYENVCHVANMLRAQGVKKGDRVCIYMPMIPELAFAVLACARIGAVHSVVFAGFSAGALIDRINDSSCKLILTADGVQRGDKNLDLKKIVDEALDKCPTIEKSIVFRHVKINVNMKAGRDLWWHEAIANTATSCEAEVMEAEDLLFILYTSGSTGKPKGMVHTCAGYMVYVAYTFQTAFQYKQGQIYWCTADIGWITGHSYVVYGPLSCGATVLMYEGAPNQPEPDRFWQIIDKHGVTVFYTAPTAIRAFMRWGDDYVKRHSLASLRLLGSVGEPINPEAWMWYHTLIGKKRCPIVDTWWQTETGGIMVTPLPGAIPTKPGSCTLPFFGVVPKVLDEKGVEVPANSGGKLFLTQPWPSMLRTLWGDDERFKKQYWSEIPGLYFCGDGARKDKDGYLWVVGRIDDVLNVSGHRIGTAEVESALVSHPSVAEAAVVGRPDDLKGQALVVFVTLKAGIAASAELKEQLRTHVGKEIGSLAKPDDVRFAAGLPKTRSGKIMRRLLKELATTGGIKGDTTTLEDFSVITALQSEE